MFFIKISDVGGLLLFGFYVLGGFFLPYFSLDLIPPLLFLLSQSLILDLLQQIVLGSNPLGMKSIFSSLLISKFGLFSGKVLRKNPLIFFFLLIFMVLYDSLGHHVHKLSLSSFPVRHFVGSFLLLGLDESGVLFLGFNVLQPLHLLFLPLHNFIPFIIFQHFPQPASLLLLPGKSLLLFLLELLLNLPHHSLVKVLLLL